MKPVAIIAASAESALGSGADAYGVGAPGESPKSAIGEDAELVRAGLRKPFVARARATLEPERDRAAQLVSRVARAIVADLDFRLPSWRTLRIGVVIGTSSGGMLPLVRSLAASAAGGPIDEELARAAPYFGPLAALDDELGVTPVERVQVLAACASSAVAIGLGCRWIEADHADLVIAGGYDAVSDFVAAGFESLGATTSSLPAPFRAARDGMALGEGAALLALSRKSVAGQPLAFVTGFGASSDAVHVTAPDRAGRGLTAAAHAALRDAGLSAEDIGLVSAHATATPFNDGAEWRALCSVLGTRASEVVIHPFKAVIGHTLGASSALELLAACDALERKILPGACGAGPLDAEASPRLLSTNERGAARHVLKLSAAFGGANAALTASVDEPQMPTVTGQSARRAATANEAGQSARRAATANETEPCAVELIAVGKPVEAPNVEAILAATRLERVQLARLDGLSSLCVAAAVEVRDHVGDPDRAGVVVGTATATLENNERFDVRLRERGARGVEPRRFPPTSPNLAPGQVSIALGLRGPSLAVGAGLGAALEALLVGYDLVFSGDAERVLIIAAEEVGPTVKTIWRAAGWPRPQHGALGLVVARAVPRASQGARAVFKRAELVECWRAVTAENGTFLGRSPGWPVLAAVLERTCP